MTRIRTALGPVAVVASLGVASVASAEPDPAVDSTPSIVATFEGKQIRLADGWGDAHACTSDGSAVQCYRTEAEMDEAEGPMSADPSQRSAMAECAAPGVRLYRGSSYSGDVLELTTRYITISLASHGFNNDTSSYKMGACDARLYDTTSGGTAYPGVTTAGTWASSMVSGWDNRVGSVYIN